MKKSFTILSVCFLFAATAEAQTVQAPSKDTIKAGKANDRLKNAGPVNDWPGKSGKMDSLNYKKDSTAAVRRKDSINRIKRNN